MNILINLIPIKTGGGQQVGSNFLIQIQTFSDLNPVFLVTKNTFIHKKLKELGFSDIFAIQDNLKSRLYFQSFSLGKIIRSYSIDVIYTMFGPGLHYRNIISVTGCAYSNLFFPEINFWEHESYIGRVKRNLIDFYRLKSTLKSDYIIFENEAMQARSVNIFGYPEDQTKLILPSVTEYKEFSPSEILKEKLEKLSLSSFKILMLSGWAKNKNLEIVPYVLKELKTRGYNEINFVITVPPDHPESKTLLARAQDFKVENNITLIDTVLPTEVPFLYGKIDAVMLLSKLESFSNNIIESWYFKKPLFISDEEWSKVICRDAAIYVARNDEKMIAEKIVLFLNREGAFEEWENKAFEILQEYPNPKEKVKMQIDFIKKILHERSS